MDIKTAPAAFVGKSGKLYVRVRRVQIQDGDVFTTRTAVYPSIEAYNQRSSIPEYEELKELLKDFKEEVMIDSQTLTISGS